jgi:hypothetical protein
MKQVNAAWKPSVLGTGVGVRDRGAGGRYSYQLSALLCFLISDLTCPRPAQEVTQAMTSRGGVRIAWGRRADKSLGDLH